MIIHHAYLIYGATKEKREEHIFKLVNSQFKFKFQNNPDLEIINGEKSIGIDQIRNLKNFLSLKPYQQKIKIAIINNSHNLTQEAQNALLKTLEEPISSLIILETSNPNRLLPTIQSRCLQIFLGNELEVTNQKRIKELLTLDTPARLSLSQELAPNIDSVLFDLFAFWRDVMLAKIEAGKSQQIPKSQLKNLKFEEITTAIDLIQKTKNNLNYNINKQLALDVLFISLPKLSQPEK